MGSVQAYAVLYGLSGRGRSSAASGPIVSMALPLTALSAVVWVGGRDPDISVGKRRFRAAGGLGVGT